MQTWLRRGETAEAEQAIATLLGDDESLRLHALGYLHRRSGRADEARGCFETALARDDGLDASRNELGWMLCASGRDDEGLALLLEAEERFVARGDDWGLATSLTHRATVAKDRFRLAEALELFERAVPLKEGCGDRLGHATALYGRAQVHYFLVDYLRARQGFDAALEIQERIGFHVGAAASLNGLGSCHLELADGRRAGEAFRRALRMLERSGQPVPPAHRAIILDNLGKASWTRGRLSEALRHHERAADIVGAQAPGSAAHELARIHVAFLHRLLGRPLQALDILTSIEQDGLDRRTLLGLEREIGQALLALDRPDETIAELRGVLQHDARTASNDSSGRVLELEVREVLGRALLAADRVDEAVETLEEAERESRAIVDGQPVRSLRIGLVERLRGLGEALVHARLRHPEHGAASAWSTATTLKARELRDLLETERSARPSRREELEATLRALSAQPDPDADALATIDTLRAQVQQLDDDELSPRAARSETLDRPVDARVLGERLGPTRALIEYCVGEETTLVFVVHGGSVETLDLPLTSRKLGRAIERVLRPLRETCESIDLVSSLHDFDLNACHRLFRQLLRPVLARLPEVVKELLVVPDGPLHALPFDLLVSEPPPSASSIDPADDPLLVFRQARFVGDDWTLAHAQSSALLCDDDAGGRGPATLLAFSPTETVQLQAAGEEQWLGPLPGAEAEVDALTAIASDGRRRVGSHATVAACLDALDDSALVHVAAHGWSDPHLPSLAGLLLSDGADGVDLLTAGRLASHPCRSRLVVLSACDTAVGRTWGREGVLGLSRAFLEAGAGAVLATLWPVDDDSTQALMVDFHRELHAGSSPAVALARARTRSRREGPVHRAHPFYWASFLLLDHRLPSSSLE
ncbi:MAG: CHAT domain-containing protein [Acidobacteriota bacterium]